MSEAKITINLSAETFPGGTAVVSGYAFELWDGASRIHNGSIAATDPEPATLTYTFPDVPAGTYTSKVYAQAADGSTIGSVQSESLIVSADVSRLVPSGFVS